VARLESKDRIAMNRFTQALAEACSQHLIDEKWLIAPTTRIGHQWLLSVAQARHPVINVDIKTPKGLALILAAPEMSRTGVTAIPTRLGQLFVDEIIGRLRRTNALRYFHGLEPALRTAKAVHATIESMRLAGMSVDDIQPALCEAHSKATDLSLIFESYLDRLREEKLADYADVLRLACRQIADRANAPSTVRLLVPPGLVLTKLERNLFDAFPAASIQIIESDSGSGEARIDDDSQHLTGDGRVETSTAFDFFHAIGEVNEIREIIRRCVSSAIPLDHVELLHTDAATYVPLIYETLSAVPWPDEEGKIPATFVEGIPSRYSRPGRALVAWLAWIRAGHPQLSLVSMIREGLLAFPGSDQEHSFTGLATTLRGVAIGIGRDRYAPKLDSAITKAQRRIDGANAGEDHQPGRSQLELPLQRLQALREMVSRLLEVSPNLDVGPDDVLLSAESFLHSVSRRVDELDNYAYERLILEIQDMRLCLSRICQPGSLDIWQWLLSLPREAEVLGSGPREGCVHIAPVSMGGHSGRAHTFVVGLDDSRFPGLASEDPVLLDNERVKLCPELPTAGQRQEQARDMFAKLLGRVSGTITFSYSSMDLASDRELSPSPALLSLYRQVSGQSLDATRFQQMIAGPTAFAPTKVEDCLSETEWWLWRLCNSQSHDGEIEKVTARYAHLARGQDAAMHRNSDQFTAYDGHVEQAGADLDPTQTEKSLITSSRQLEQVGQCPLAFFMRYGLRVEKPKDLIVDPNRWLDSLPSGKLLHEVFEEFIRELIDPGRAPSFDRDLARLLGILNTKMAVYRDLYPPPSDSIYASEASRLTHVAHTFLEEEDLFCREHECTPVFIELAFGMKGVGDSPPTDSDDVIPVVLPNGKTIRARGRVDRIDRLGRGAVATFRIWDYKTGSDFSYERSDPFRQGRLIQPALYLTMVEHRLRKAVAPDAQVSHFGFFFPGLKSHGIRIDWPRERLAEGGLYLERLCQVIANGAFLATDNYEQDCKFCEYQCICGDVREVSAASERKLANPENTLLQPFRELRTNAHA
jgi:ATP-dependent helicase/nuclease subunit B